ncbi:MAG: hypothetical protein ACU0BK_11965 [Shimia sp.]|uniref:hypothetical protein n=1 Tax=Shimia sp. TaxID=1954381 RepID=UPI004059C5BC
MLRALRHLLIVALLTIVTQLGGVAWVLSLFFRRPWLAFLAFYGVLSVAAAFSAPMFGKTALSCLSGGPLQVQSWFYCASNRTFVKTELADVLEDAAGAVNKKYPGSVTLVLDASFPFFDGFPLLPHLSHDDAEKVDLAFYYADETGYLPGRVRAPLAYFAFEDGPTHCENQSRSMRWDMNWVQGLWRSYEVEPMRTAYLLRVLARDQRVGKVFLEPHLRAKLGLSHAKIRFQGCRAARHDDHIHLQM